jgi:hypothetical protein
VCVDYTSLGREVENGGRDEIKDMKLAMQKEWEVFG